MDEVGITEKLAQLTLARHQFERQMLHIRKNEIGGCNCARKQGRYGGKDFYRTDKSCDLCGPFIAGLNRARTEIDRVSERHLRHLGFDPEAKADEFINNYTASLRGEFSSGGLLHV